MSHISNLFVCLTLVFILNKIINAIKCISLWLNQLRVFIDWLKSVEIYDSLESKLLCVVSCREFIIYNK